MEDTPLADFEAVLPSSAASETITNSALTSVLYDECNLAFSDVPCPRASLRMGNFDTYVGSLDYLRCCSLHSWHSTIGTAQLAQHSWHSTVGTTQFAQHRWHSCHSWHETPSSLPVDSRTKTKDEIKEMVRTIGTRRKG